MNNKRKNLLVEVEEIRENDLTRLFPVVLTHGSFLAVSFGLLFLGNNLNHNIETEIKNAKNREFVNYENKQLIDLNSDKNPEYTIYTQKPMNLVPVPGLFPSMAFGEETVYRKSNNKEKRFYKTVDENLIRKF